MSPGGHFWLQKRTVLWQTKSTKGCSVNERVQKQSGLGSSVDGKVKNGFCLERTASG